MMNTFCRLVTQAVSSTRSTLASHAIKRSSLINQSLRTFSTIKLNTIKPLEGAYRRERILGRGRSSGLGKTSGRGQKGQNARSGRRSRVRYEGGQTMLWRRTPKRGFKNVNRQPLSPLSVGKLVDYICAGRIDARKEITLHDIYKSNIMGNFKYGVKLLGTGVDKVARLPVPINITVSHASESVVEAIKAAGGNITFAHYSRLALRSLKAGKETAPSVPPPRKALRYDMQLYGKDGLVKAAEIRLARIVRKVRVR